MVRPKPYWTVRKVYWTRKSKTCFNKQTKWTTKVLGKFWFFEWKIYFKWNKKSWKKFSLPTAAFKEDTNLFSSEFRECFGLWLWLCNKALIDQLIRSNQENIRTSNQENIWISLHSVCTSKLRSEYFPVVTTQLVSKSIVLVVRKQHFRDKEKV